MSRTADTGFTFTVDTHLFRELGELLVGRDSTALVELIKNAYDADATEVTVYAESLDIDSGGLIRITDNGNGMNLEEFKLGFLRIASRTKEQGNRLSRRFSRRFTGAKGIGRLAAHKLARKLTVTSIPWTDKEGRRSALEAAIDWSLVEECSTLDELESRNETLKAVTVREIPTETRKHGTTISLSGLRRRWTKTARVRFISEVQAFSPPSVLTQPLRTILPDSVSSLLTTPEVRLASGNGAQFSVRLEGDFAGGDQMWEAFASAADWVIEIKASRTTLRVEYFVSPTKRFRKEFPAARSLSLAMNQPEVPTFEARIFVKEGRKAEDVWPAHASGLRVYMEGFRVPPYGEPQNDWLALDADYTRRQRTHFVLPEIDADIEPENDEMLSTLPNRAFFGAVFLTQESSPALQMLINREGFVPGPAFEALSAAVRAGINLSTRLRAAAKHALKEEHYTSELPPHSSSDLVHKDDESRGRGLKTFVVRARHSAREARRLIAAGDTRGAQDKFSEAIELLEFGADRSEKVIDEQKMLRVLASVGTQMSSFIHEVNGLLGMSEAVEQALERIRRECELSREAKSRLIAVLKSAGELKRALERHAAYLVDVVTPDVRRRRTRMSFAERFDAASRVVDRVADARGVQIENAISDDLKSPPMFPAELTAVFANLLTNAVKAAGKDGRIFAEAHKEPSGETVVLVHNTGVAVGLEESERWFRPFESTTTTTDPVLGQGMGLGLTITRNMLEQYGASIRFVRPRRGFSTCLELRFAAQ